MIVSPSWLTHFKYRTDEKHHDHHCETDKRNFCSLIFDIIFGFQFWEACKIHDFFYDGRSPSGIKHPQPDTFLSNLPYIGIVFYFIEAEIGRLYSDFIFYRKLRRIVNNNYESLAHWLLGQFSAILYYIAVTLCGWLFYQPGLLYILLRR